MAVCCVCEKEREPEKVLELTDDEKTMVRLMSGKEAPDSYSYCKPCWLLVSDRVQGPQLLKGLLQVGLKQAGVRNPEQIATKYQEFMLQHGYKKPISS